MIFEQNSVRIPLGTAIDPAVGLIDINTDQRPKFWRAAPVALQVVVFGPSGLPVDLSNLVGLQLTIQKSPTSLSALVSQTLVAAQLQPTFTTGGWQGGVEQQAQFDLSAAEMDLGLDAAPSAEFWLSVAGLTYDNRRVVYGSGYVRVYNPSNQLPTPMPGIVSFNAQVNTSGGASIAPSSLLHTESITVGGAASTRNFVVVVSGLANGSRISILVLFDGTAENGTVINIYNTSTSGTLLYTFTRSGGETSALFLLIADGAGGLVKGGATIPAY